VRRNPPPPNNQSLFVHAGTNKFEKHGMASEPWFPAGKALGSERGRAGGGHEQQLAMAVRWAYAPCSARRRSVCAAGQRPVPSVASVTEGGRGRAGGCGGAAGRQCAGNRLRVNGGVDSGGVDHDWVAAQHGLYSQKYFK
jgi:hypothetical protein